MQIYISDANIFIDLIKTEMIDIFFQIKQIEIRTTDFVFEELYDDQKTRLQKHVKSGKLHIVDSEKEDIELIAKLLISHSGLGFQDCSIWHHARKLNAILLTGDKKLKMHAEEDGIEVHGILFILDLLLLRELLSFSEAIRKIERLYQINGRLPVFPKEERVRSWNQSKHYRTQ